MSRQPPIEPKPTQYGNLLFRSRLEARWAVFLDYTENVLNWEYEPKTFKLRNGWTYTPDFSVTLFPWGQALGKFKPELLYMEVKPKPATLDYQKGLGQFAAEKKILLFLVYGDFYSEGIKSCLYPANNKRQSVTVDAVFAKVPQAYYHATHFRFDI